MISYNLKSRIAAVAALVAILAVPAAAQTIAITGGKVYPVSGPPIENGTVIITNGKIAAVGANVPIPAGAQRIDATGKIVTPGFVDSFTQLGVQEVSAVNDTRDASARGKDNIAASFTIWEGLNPNSVLLAPARKEGITTVVVVPQGGLVSGQAALVDLVPGTMTDMIIKAPVAMVAEIGNPLSVGLASRGEVIGKLRELLEDTKFFQTHRDAFDRAATRPFAASRLDLQALIPVVEGKLPLLVSVNRVSDIDAAMRLARDYNIKLIISNAAEAWMMADKIAAARIPVLTGAMNNIPDNFATLGSRQENAGLLRKAGVQVGLIGNGGGDEEAFNVRNLKVEAGNAVSYGMTWDDALRAVTLAPAEFFGAADRVGSLRPGLEANVVVWSGDPFEFTTRAEHVFVRGHEYNEKTRQDQLIERYLLYRALIIRRRSRAG
ncbi:MAG TPA: amidohydrolase family protein [Gemmatimonadaceae bacterium]|nr:amidohydrolase family protein [Gemmatimonadaceae bacterium]